MTLSFAEERVLRMRARGLTSKAVAYQIGISDQTVKNHMASIYRKLDADNLQSALAAMGWVAVPGEPIVRRQCDFVGQCGRSFVRAPRPPRRLPAGDVMSKPVVFDPRAAAIRNYSRRADSLRAEAMRARDAGYNYWATEYEALAAIAERAAKAEVVNQPPGLLA